jgi:hypothetical protein
VALGTVIRRRDRYLLFINFRVMKGILMKTTSKVLGLVLLTLVAAQTQAGPARAPATPHIAINPQPLPPRPVDNSVRIAINPQPLPPRGSDAVVRNISSRPYVGETERNWR